MALFKKLFSFYFFSSAELLIQYISSLAVQLGSAVCFCTILVWTMLFAYIFLGFLS